MMAPDWFIEFDQQLRWYGFIAFLILVVVFTVWQIVRAMKGN
jgi:hypothetical protein